MDRQDLLLEIGCEELPTHAVKFLADHLTQQLLAQLKICGLIDSPLSQTFATPRRLAVYVENVKTQLPPQLIERMGPAYDKAFDSNGQPTAAALGFAKSCGVEIAALAQKDNRLFFKSEKPSQKTLDILPDILRQAIQFLPIPKPMRWGTHTESFARPVHWILCLFGAEVAPLTIFDITSSNQTFGHRFHHPDKILLHEAKQYAQILREQGSIIANYDLRKNTIWNQIQQIIPKEFNVPEDEDLLNEVTSLVEWPVALLGHFNPEYLKVPAEVLTTSMKVNQKYFPVYQHNQLQPLFVLISNIESKDSKLVVHGNERVLNARLADAAFFYKNDLAHSLESRLLHLEHMTFQKQLGSLAHKTERLVKLAGIIATELKVDASTAQQAAQLSKCDLLSEMVGEFPSLQGVMGYYYAKNDGCSEDCALAIKEHYYPRFSGDQLPTSIAGKIVALADRLDTLIGIFGINQAPSGDKDPFALRRAALGILRILIEGKLSLDLKQLFKHAQQAYTHHLPNQEAINQALEFTINRLHSWYLELGFGAKQIEAVLASGATDPLDFAKRVQAVEKFQQLPEAPALSAANKRVSNILKKQAGDQWPTRIDAQLFEHEAERMLAEQLATQTKIVNQLYAQSHYTEALSQLSSLKEPVDLFFDKVMVMVDDKAKRENRLALLAGLHHLFTQVADISLL